MGYHWDWSVFSHQAGSGSRYADWLLAGLETTVSLGLIAWAIALVVGGVLGVLRTVPNRVAKAVSGAYVELFRNVPLLVQVFFWYFAVPELVPFGERLKDLSPMTQQFVAASLALGFYTAARVCEQVRAGLQALQSGQRTAALAMGLTLAQSYRLILLPQAMRTVLPPLTSEFLGVFKNSAVASTIGLMELASQGRQLVDYTSQPYEAFIAVTALYALVNWTVMILMRWIERRSRLPGFAQGR